MRTTPVAKVSASGERTTVGEDVDFARNAADRVVLLHHGEVVEDAEPEQFFGNPQHDRTRRFLSSSLARKG